MSRSGDEELQVATIPLVEEEIAALILLAEGSGAVSVTGTVACDSLESVDFDVGFRGLLAKSLVELDGQEVRISDGALALARCMVQADVLGLLVVTSDNAHDIMSVASSDDHSALVRSRGVGAYQISLWRGSVSDVIWAIADDLRVEVEGAEWSAGIRLHLAGAEPFDFVVGHECTGLVKNNLPVAIDDQTVKSELDELVLMSRM